MVSVGSILCLCALYIVITQYIAEWWLLPVIVGLNGIELIMFGLKRGE